MKASILIADHDPVLAEAVRRCLATRGYEVVTALDDLECQEQLRKMMPTVLVLDSEILWRGGDGVLNWLISDEPLMVVVAEGPVHHSVPDRLEPWIDATIQRPASLQDLLTFVHQLESLAWWSQSPSRTAATSPQTASFAR